MWRGYACYVTGANAIAGPSSMLSPVRRGPGELLPSIAAEGLAMTDHVRACAAAAPARYRASSSAKAASKSSSRIRRVLRSFVAADLDDAKALNTERLGR